MNDGTFFGFQMMMMGNKRKLKLLSNGGRGKNLKWFAGRWADRETAGGVPRGFIYASRWWPGQKIINI